MYHSVYCNFIQGSFLLDSLATPNHYWECEVSYYEFFQLKLSTPKNIHYPCETYR